MLYAKLIDNDLILLPDAKRLEFKVKKYGIPFIERIAPFVYQLTWVINARTRAGKLEPKPFVHKIMIPHETRELKTFLVRE